MFYVKHYKENQPDEILQSFESFDDALRYESDLIKKGRYKKDELCIEDFIR